MFGDRAGTDGRARSWLLVGGMSPQGGSCWEQWAVTCGSEQARAVTSTHGRHPLGRAWLGGPGGHARRAVLLEWDIMAPMATGETASLISDEKAFVSLYPCR